MSSIQCFSSIHVIHQFMLFINSCYSSIHVIHQFMLFINSCYSSIHVIHQFMYSSNVIHQFNVFQLIACKHVLLKLFRPLDFNTNYAKKFNCLILIRFSYNNPYRKPYYVTYSHRRQLLRPDTKSWGVLKT